nr:MAG TPA: hypothetical protein [Caudoviricetes sp.]
MAQYSIKFIFKPCYIQRSDSIAKLFSKSKKNSSIVIYSVALKYN